MAIKICRDGKELEIQEAVNYLERQYGIPAKDIRAIGVSGEVGQPILIDVTLYVQAEEPADLGHEGSDRWTGGDKKDAP